MSETQGGGGWVRLLKKKYGKNKKTRDAINAAYRAEYPDGDRNLDHLTGLNGSLARAVYSGETARAAKIREQIAAVEAVIDRDRDELIAKYVRLAAEGESDGR